MLVIFIGIVLGLATGVLAGDIFYTKNQDYNVTYKDLL